MQQTAPDPSWRRWGVRYAALAGVWLALAAWQLRWMSDDGFINIRVVEQVVAGHGPVFNAGERVEVATSTLWLWLLVGLKAGLPVVEVQVAGLVLSIALTLVGVGCVTAAAVRLHGRRPDAGVPLPLGLWVLCCIPGFWTYMTSGLENGLSFAWIGASVLGLTWRLTAPDAPQEPWRPAWVPLVIGLGPLVRPDLTLMAAVFAVVWLRWSRVSWRGWLATAGVALALPVGWEVFRAGFYAALVPNTALVKASGESRWAEGGYYFFDFAAAYHLWVPLVAVLLAGVAFGRRLDAGRARWVCWAPVVAGLLHAVYLAKVGGDFMHARMATPALFAILAPFAVIGVPRGRALVRVVAAAVLAWGVVTAATTTNPYAAWLRPEGSIFDERSFYLRQAQERGFATNISMASWRGDWGFQVAQGAARDDAAGVAYFQDDDLTRHPRDTGTVLAVRSLGTAGIGAGLDLHVVDRYGLAEPFHSRTVLPPGTDYRIGHPIYPSDWRVARYAAPQASDSANVRAIRRALSCQPLAELDAALTAPLTAERFVQNLALAPRLTFLRIPADGADAAAAFCGASDRPA